ncbi:MAG: ATP-grasp domain-containing protein, partial [Candidatus Kapabacteria bacterium]|nr:ATP-grasp domain-containing protein [Candidatus Kapabacteria bacterium]
MLKSIYHKDKTFTLGILGGGQLAKMLAASAYRLGLNVAVIENHASSPAGDMTKSEYANGWFDKQQLADFIEESDIITLENEFIDPEILDEISKFRDVYPGPATMRLVQDKFIQKTTFRNAGLPVPGFAEINSLEELLEFGNKYGYPFVLKARKYGYDGYGNSTIFKRENCEVAWKKFKSDNSERLMMAEAFVNFNKELAVIAVRNTKGETEVYPCVETVQYRHICHEVIAPAEVDEKIRLKACKLALDCVKSIDGIGVFGVEMFL